jgi:hypothetical protein
MKLVLDVEAGNLIEFFKNNPNVKINELPAREIAYKYLFEDVYQDSDFEYIPKEFLMSVFLEFLYISTYEFEERQSRLVVNKKVIDSWYKKCDNLISLIKNQEINFDNARIKIIIESIYQTLEYPPLFDLIIEGYRNITWSNELRLQLVNYNPNLYKKLAALDIIPPPYSKEEEKLYKEAKHNAILDMSIGLRGSGLPSLVLENIANQAYMLDNPLGNPTGMDVYSLVKNVTERK